MKVEFADSFWKSLKTLSRHQTWWYKTYELFRYKIPMFIENLWFFRKELWEFRSWDYSYNLSLLKRSLEKTCNTLEFYGMEVEISRMKKVNKIKRAIQIIESINEGHYISRAEEQIGELQNTDWFLSKDDTPEERTHNKKVFELSDKIENDEWKELFRILEGQDRKEYFDLYDSKTDDEKRSEDVWNDWYDGSGLKNWWD